MRPFLASVTRISDLDSEPFEVTAIGREHWATGDYVCAEVMRAAGTQGRVELPNGRMAELFRGDHVVGALARRHATLEAVGDWREVADDGHMEALTAAGLFGRATSVSPLIRPLVPLRYVGHVVRSEAKVAMSQFALTSPPERPDPGCVDTILVVGTSMSAGKTTSAKAIVRAVTAMGRRAVGAKLTGAGRYQDVLAMGDAGAVAIYDFVDAGLPSTVCEAEVFRPALRNLLARIAADQPDVLVAESGASPFEPYNGRVVLEEISGHLKAIVLCASDPYAVVGVMRGFGVTPDLVCGPTTNTTAGRELVEKLTSVPASNLLLPEARRALVGRLEEWLAREPRPTTGG